MNMHPNENARVDSPSSANPTSGIEERASPVVLAALADHSAALAAITARVAESTVAVLGHRRAAASGVVWQRGLVVSAAHVLRRSPNAMTLVGAEGALFDATLVGIDVPTDLALFRIDEQASPPPVDKVDAGSVRAGHIAIAVGRSGEGDVVASHGIVNRASGAWQTWLGGQLDQLVRLDGGIYEGLSGAPVADARGAVIGIATAALSRSYGIVVPTSTVDRVVAALAAQGRVTRPWLGIGAQPVALPGGGAGESALLVNALAEGGPAARAGVLVGDIVVRAAGEPASHLRALRDALGAHVGRKATLAIVRGGVARDLDVEVAQWPGERRC